MEISVTGRNLGVTDRFREYATEKAEKVDHLAEKAIAFEVKVSRHHETRGSSGDDRVELTLIGPGPLVRAEAVECRQVRRLRPGHGQAGRAHPPGEGSQQGAPRKAPPDVAARGVRRRLQRVDITPGRPGDDREGGDRRDPDRRSGGRERRRGEEYSPVVIRTKVFAATPMTVDDALYHMELVGHDFYLFIDAETRSPERRLPPQGLGLRRHRPRRARRGRRASWH